MKELELEYYFENINNFTFKEIFDGCKYPWEALSKIKVFLEDKIVKDNLFINKGTIRRICFFKW